jgi:hypothetical protein
MRPLLARIGSTGGLFWRRAAGGSVFTPVFRLLRCERHADTEVVDRTSLSIGKLALRPIDRAAKVTATGWDRDLVEVKTAIRAANDRHSAWSHKEDCAGALWACCGSYLTKASRGEADDSGEDDPEPVTHPKRSSSGCALAVMQPTTALTKAAGNPLRPNLERLDVSPPGRMRK